MGIHRLVYNSKNKIKKETRGRRAQAKYAIRGGKEPSLEEERRRKINLWFKRAFKNMMHPYNPKYRKPLSPPPPKKKKKKKKKEERRKGGKEEKREEKKERERYIGLIRSTKHTR